MSLTPSPNVFEIIRFVALSLGTKASNKKLDDLIINLKPKVIRFIGEKFPNELWGSGCQIKKIRKYLTKI